MKKILALILALICLSSMTALATSPVMTEVTEDKTGYTELAPTAVITVNDNYEGITYNGEYFVIFNANNLDMSGFDDLKCIVSLTDAQKERIDRAIFSINLERTVIYATYSFSNGTSLNAHYIKNDCIPEFDRVMSDDWKRGEIEFQYPYDNQLKVEKEKLLGKQVNLFTPESSWSEFMVYSSSDEVGIKRLKGCLVADGDKYYYIDFEVAQITPAYDFAVTDYPNVIAFEITDKALTAQIKNSIELYYDDDYGFLEDDKITSKISDILLIFMFLILPLGLFVLFLVLAIRSKTKYRKFFRAIYILALITLLLFIIISAIL